MCMYLISPQVPNFRSFRPTFSRSRDIVHLFAEVFLIDSQVKI